MKNNTTAVLSLLIAALLALCITGLTLAHQPAPEILSTIALVALGIGGGIANPRATSDAAAAVLTAAEPAPAVIPAPAPAPAVESLPAPVATHAP